MPIKSVIAPLIRRLSRKSIELFLENLVNLLCYSKKGIEDLQSFLNVLIHLTNRYFPKKTICRKQFKVAENSWISPDILSCTKQKISYITTVYKLKMWKILLIIKN